MAFCLAQTAAANETNNVALGFSEDTRLDILSIGENIRDNNLISSPITKVELKTVQALPTEERLILLRRLASAVIMERREIGAVDILKLYQEEAISANSSRDIEVSDLFENYLQIRTLGPDHADSITYLDKINAAKNDPDWFVAHRAYTIHSVLLARQNKYNDALKALNQAAMLRPDEVDRIVREASYEQSIMLAFVYTVTGNASATIDAIEHLIVQGQELQETIDGVTYFNNLIYISSKWREFELSSELATLMLDIPGLMDHEKAIGNMRLAQSLNRLGKFEEALRASAAGIDLNPAGNWAINLQIERAIAFAGVGDVESARATLLDIQTTMQDNPRFSRMFQKSLLQIEALIAVAQDDPDTVYETLIEYNRIDMQRQLRFNDQSNTYYLQIMQKSEAVTREREAKQRAKLEAITLERDNRTKQLTFAVVLTVLLGIFTVIGMYLARFYKRTSKENAHLRDLALAGERSKSEFLAVMSHELRTPLNGIIGLSDVLSREAENEDVKFKSSVIMRSGLTLLDLLTNILDMSQMERGQLAINPAPMSVRDLIDGIGELWLPKAKAQGLILTLHVDDGVPESILLDNMRLRQCAENLISNAIKFTKTGRVHVHVTSAQANKNGTFILTLIVADTGCGMSQDQIDTVFEPFTQADTSISREYDGSGLGMAITRSLARLMGGDVTVSSREGRGSEFTLSVETRTSQAPKVVTRSDAHQLQHMKTDRASAEDTQQDISTRAQRIEKIDAAITAANLAANTLVAPQAEHVGSRDDQMPETRLLKSAARQAEAEAAAPPLTASSDDRQDAATSDPTPAYVVPTPKSAAHSSDPFRGLRVLIAEDIISNQDILRVFLKPVGSIVTFAANGKEAIDAIEQEDFDLVLMDIRMPVMNGIEATSKIRAMHPDKASIPIIALTADASAENNAQCMAAGANVFLTKPVIATELFGSIRFVLKQAEQQRQRRRA